MANSTIGLENGDNGRGDFTLYDMSERGADSKYPSWKDGTPNLQTYLNAINKSQPIIQCQFELVWSRWPRTIFFAKNISIPGISVQTQDISHAGFTIKIPTHVTYETTEITLNILADKEGFHYYDLRNMVMQTGHPLVAGDPKATIGNPFGISPDEDTLEVRLRNKPEDTTHHHWILHNFHPIGVGDIELAHDSSSFVEFELKGTFTHITYDCGQTLPMEQSPLPSQDEGSTPENNGEGEQDSKPGLFDDDVEVEVQFPEDQEGFENPDEGTGEEGEEEGSEEDEDQQNWDGQDENTDQDWEQQEQAEKAAAQEQEQEGGGEEEATLDDDDERAAYEAMQEGGDKPREQLQKELEEKFRQENPNEDPEIIETRAEFALDAAEKYAKQHPQQKGIQERDVPDEFRPRLVLYRNKCGWIGEEFGDATPYLAKAVRYNHKVGATKAKLFLDDVEQELVDYSHKAAQLTLPHRFGMYRTPTKDIPKTSEIEIEVPKSESSERNVDPNHKRRSIFD